MMCSGDHIPAGWKKLGAADIKTRPSRSNENAMSSVLRIPLRSATEPRKNIEMVIPAVRTRTMWCDATSGFSTPRKTKSEKYMAR